MPTTNFNNLILAIGRRLKSTRSLATDNLDADGNLLTYSSAILTEYANRSLKDLLIDNFFKMGGSGFQERFPEYVKTSGALTLSSGVVAKPTDAFIITNLSTSGGVEFKKLTQKQVEDVRRGVEMIIVPSVTRPVFWEESGNINTLGVVSGDVIARYIQTPTDITPIVTVGDGSFSTSTGTWTALTRILQSAMHSAFTSSSVGKYLMFRDTTKTYFGIIDSFVAYDTVTLRAGDGLPVTNITTQTITVSDIAPDARDIKINPFFYAEIINRAVQYGLQDAKNSVIT